MHDVIIDGVKYVPVEEVKKNLTVTDIFEKYLGTKEYEGIVGTIQKWYYGSLVKASWCATSMSWCLGQLGIMKVTIGTKEENVYNFNAKLKNVGSATPIPTDATLQRGDILIFLWSGKFSTTASKHITSCYETCNVGQNNIKCLGGNQSDSISIQTYDRSKLYAVYRPDYSRNTIKSYK